MEDEYADNGYPNTPPCSGGAQLQLPGVIFLAQTFCGLQASCSCFFVRKFLLWRTFMLSTISPSLSRVVKSCQFDRPCRRWTNHAYPTTMLLENVIRTHWCQEYAEFASTNGANWDLNFQCICSFFEAQGTDQNNYVRRWSWHDTVAQSTALKWIEQLHIIPQSLYHPKG